jgi:hypothetical protein
MYDLKELRMKKPLRSAVRVKVESISLDKKIGPALSLAN